MTSPVWQVSIHHFNVSGIDGLVCDLEWIIPLNRLTHSGLFFIFREVKRRGEKERWKLVRICEGRPDSIATTLIHRSRLLLLLRARTVTEHKPLCYHHHHHHHPATAASESHLTSWEDGKDADFHGRYPLKPLTPQSRWLLTSFRKSSFDSLDRKSVV